MKILFFVSIALFFLTVNMFAQDKPIYTMGKDNPVIFEPEDTEREQDNNDEDRINISMYKDQIVIEKKNEDNPPKEPEKPKLEGEKAPTILRKETE